MCLRLGIRPYTGINEHCQCGRALASAPYDHLLMCLSVRKNALFARHERVVRCVQMIAARAGVTTQLNVRDPLLGDRLQPDLQLDGVHTRLISDVTVIHPSSPSQCQRAARDPLSAARAGEALKRRKYAGRAVNGYTFTPFALESFGGVGSGAVQVITALAIDADATGASIRAFKSWALCAVSVALQAGNGRVIGEGLKWARLAPVG